MFSHLNFPSESQRLRPLRVGGDGSTATLQNCTFADNRNERGGFSVECSGGRNGARLQGCTFVGNEGGWDVGVIGSGSELYSDDTSLRVWDARRQAVAAALPLAAAGDSELSFLAEDDAAFAELQQVRRSPLV
jgi:hypothetical protein